MGSIFVTSSELAMTSLVSLPNFQCGNRREYFGDCHLLSQLPRLLSEIAGQLATRPHVLSIY